MKHIFVVLRTGVLFTTTQIQIGLWDFNGHPYLMSVKSILKGGKYDCFLKFPVVLFGQNYHNWMKTN